MVVRDADEAIAIVVVVVPVVRVVLVVAVVRAAVVVRVVRARRWARKAVVLVVREDQVAAIAARVVLVPIVVLEAHVGPAVRRTDSRKPPPMRAGKMQVRRASRALAPMANRCRRAASARVSRSVPTQTASDPMESRGIPSVVQSARRSVRQRLVA